MGIGSFTINRIPRRNQRHMLDKFSNTTTWYGVNLDRANIILEGGAIVVETRDYSEGNRLEVIKDMNYYKNNHGNSYNPIYYIDELVYDEFLKREVYKEVSRREFLKEVRKRGLAWK